MLELSEQVDRKFIDSIDLDEWEIETDTGWHDITHIHKTVEYVEWEVVTSSGKKLISADDHILFDENMNQVFVKDLIPNISFIMTRDGAEQVVSLVQTDRSSNMYDLTVDSDNHRFWSDDILSHNTTAIVAAAIWYATFHEAKAIGILANKGATARQILARVKLAYEHLPKWLQQGAVEWNKGSVQFENGSSILAAATSSDNIRGTPLSCIIIDETAFIKNWEEFSASVLPTISSGETTKLVQISTPNGLNHFYKTYSLAKEKKSEFILTEVPWQRVPGRDEAWKQKALSDLSYDQLKFDQEYCLWGLSEITIRLNNQVTRIQIEELDGYISGRVHSIRFDESRRKVVYWHDLDTIGVEANGVSSSIERAVSSGFQDENSSSISRLDKDSGFGRDVYSRDEHDGSSRAEQELGRKGVQSQFAKVHDSRVHLFGRIQEKNERLTAKEMPRSFGKEKKIDDGKESMGRSSSDSHERHRETRSGDAFLEANTRRREGDLLEMVGIERHHRGSDQIKRVKTNKEKCVQQNDGSNLWSNYSEDKSNTREILYNTANVEILTPTGFKKFVGLIRRKVDKVRRITLLDGTIIESSIDHPYVNIPYDITEDTIIQKDRFLYDPYGVEGSVYLHDCDVVSHNCNEFAGSSGTLISGSALKALVGKVPLVESADGLKQYQAPGNGRYVIMADVSEGKGLDYSVAQVIDITTMPYNQAAVFRSNLFTPIDYASILNHLSIMYNGAHILVENNSIGKQVADMLHYDFGNENVISTVSAGHHGKKVSGGFAANSERGLRMSKATKAIGCSMLKLLVEQQQLIINDSTTITELSTFSRKSLSWAAEPGCNDDCVMSLVLFGWLSNQKYFTELNDINTMHKLREKTEEQIMDDMLPFGFRDDGQSDEYAEGAFDNRLLDITAFMFRS